VGQRKLEALGYWFNERAPNAYPRPQRLVGAWPARQRAQVLAHLRAGSMFERYRACSHCRFACGIRPSELGRRDLTDGVWVWPEGLAHYVEAHSVRLPARFVRHVAARGLPARREGLIVPSGAGGWRIDEASWLAWGRAQGASVELSGWEVPGEQDRRTIEAELAKVARVLPWKRRLPWKRPVITLARARTREVVLALPRGRLAIVQLGATPRLEIVDGWDDWPARRPPRNRSRRRPARSAG